MRSRLAASFVPHALAAATMAALVATLIAACGPGRAPVSSTTTAHRLPDRAPTAPTSSASDTTGAAALPAATDVREGVVFVRAGSIHLRRAVGGELIRLTFRSAASPDAAPALSPDGTRIAYASRRDGVSQIHVARIDGSETRALTDGVGGGDGEPTWSSDGARIVFVRGATDSPHDLHIVSASGGPTTLLLAGADDAPALVGAPTWSPDGRVIIFAADRREGLGTGLFSIAPDGSGLRRLTRPASPNDWARDLRPAWSPDGARLAFASNRHAASADDAADFDLYTLEVASGTLARLTRDPGVADDPAFSPDGRRLYFTSTRDAPRPASIELFVMPANGGEQRRLTRDELPENSAPHAGLVP